MMDESFLIGVLSGVVASFLVYVATHLIKRIVSELIRRLNPGPDITGTWDIYDRNSNLVGNIQINQKGCDVKATFNQIIKNSNRSVKYECTGKFSFGKLSLMFEDINMKGFNVGVMHLYLCADNKTLKGKMVYQNHDNGRVVANDIVFKRM